MRQFIAAFGGSFLGAGIRRFADVVRMGTGRINFDLPCQAGTFDMSTQRSLRGRGAADISHASQQDFDHDDSLDPEFSFGRAYRRKHRAISDYNHA